MVVDTRGVDWLWCYEYPKDAAEYIARLERENAALRKQLGDRATQVQPAIKPLSKVQRA
jgi:uncharacterized protein (DUF427 family)